MNKNILIILIVLGSFYAVDAQDTTDSNLDRTFQIIVDLENQLDSASRNFSGISEPPREVQTVPQEYAPRNFEIELNKVNPKIPVYGISPKPLPDILGNYVKAGFGNYVTPYLEAFVNSKRNKQMKYGLYYKHLSSANGPVDKKNSGIGHNRLRGYGDYFYKDYKLSADLDYNRYAHRYYGYSDTLTDIPELDSIRRNFNSFKGTLGLNNFQTDGDLRVNADVIYQFIGDNRESSESEFVFKGRGNYELAESSNIYLDTRISLSSKNDSSSNLGRSFLWFKPHYRFKKGRVFIDAGVNSVIENDTLRGTNSFHLYPSVLLDVILSYPPGFRLYAGLDGNMERNTWRSMVMENPYLIWGAPVFNSNNTLTIYGGAKSTILKNFTFDASVAFSSYENMYFYVNSTIDPSQYTVVYDTGTTTQVKFKTELMYTKNKHIKAGLKIEANDYNTSTISAAYHRPSFKSSLLAGYNHNEKIYVDIDFFFISGITARDPENLQDITLDPIVDLNLKGEYKFNEKASVFAEANNLISKEYQRYLYYPSKGINFLLGLTYAF